MKKVAVVIAMLAGYATAAGAGPGDVADYREQYRPQFHFSPPSQWMNDPNGMVYLDGEYHVFYQHYPYANRWGPMHWGHAVSRDLVHWKNLPIALYPDEHGSIFSGSAVYDRDNTSGLGTRGHAPLVAMFTFHDHRLADQGGDRFQTQGLAYSLDKGRSWTKYAGNPVLANPGERDFRDPKLSWYAPGKKWIVTLAVGDHVSFYSSKDLRHWTFESDFGREWGSHRGVWECPDLFPMQVAGSATSKYVLLVSINPGAPNGGSATQYFVGAFDGHRFLLEPALQQRLRAVSSSFPAGTAFEDFRGDLSRWTASGPAFSIEHGPAGNAFLQSYGNGIAATGRLRSRPFVISQPFVNFSIGGGQYPGVEGVNLLVDGELVRAATGDNGNRRGGLGRAVVNTSARNVAWDVHQWLGREAQIEVVDGVADDHGYVVVGPIVFAGEPATDESGSALWVDAGADDYAGVTWSGVPDQDGRRLFLGWMSNWQYAENVPTTHWRSAMTLPRELRLVAVAGSYELQSLPARELVKLRHATQALDPQRVHGEIDLTRLAHAQSGLLEINLDLETGNANLVTMVFANARHERTVFRINRSEHRLELDRSESGATAFSNSFTALQTAALKGSAERLSLRIFQDQSSLEIFLDDGATVMTSIMFPSTPYDTVTLGADGDIDLRSGSVSELLSIWDRAH